MDNLISRIIKFCTTVNPPYPNNKYPWNVWEPMRDPITKECTCAYCKDARQEREKVKNG